MVGEGELFGLLGPNGAGKSTLVKIAVGLVRQTRGEAEVAGARAGSRTARASLGLSRGALPLPGWYSANEVLELHQRLAGSRGGDAERRRLLELVALSDAADRRVDGMSKGMQQRLGIAQALVGEPRLLLLDEPTSALDPVGRRTVRLLLEDLRGRGVSVLLNSHLLSEVELVCDRVAILLAGEVVAAGTPHELSRPRGVELETDEGIQDDPGRDARGRTAARRRGDRGGQAGLRRSRAHLDARGDVSRGRGRGDGLSTVAVIVEYGFREAVRRKVFTVVLVLTAAFLFLFWLANHYVFRELSTITPPEDVHVDSRTFAGAFLVGLAMFATMFLGVVLAVFLTLGVVSADAERGLLQPLVVRPVGRCTLLLSRFLGAGAVCVVYVLGVYFIALSITGVTGHWWPDQIVWPGRRARGRRADRDRALAARLGRAVGNGERDRRVHALRRGPRRGPARLDRARAQLALDQARVDDRVVGAAVRGAVPGRAADDHGEHVRADGLPAAARAVRRRVRARLADPRVGGRVSRAGARRGGRALPRKDL